MRTTTAAFFLFAMLAAALAAAGAEERLIPFDEFYVSVRVPAAGGFRFFGPWPEPEVHVLMQRDAKSPQGATGIAVICRGLKSADQRLAADEVAALMEAFAAAENGRAFRKEIVHGTETAVFEAVAQRVRMQHRGEFFYELAEGVRLKEKLAKAAAAEAWYQKLMSGSRLPEKTEEAHPPKAPSYHLVSRLGAVHADGVDYVISLEDFTPNTELKYLVRHGLEFIRLGGGQGGRSGEWVRQMLEQVALALKAAGRKEAFKFESPHTPEGTWFAVTANLETQRADVAFDPGSYKGKHSPLQGSFDAKQLAEIRELEAQGAAREKWFKEHEAWFFEKE